MSWLAAQISGCTKTVALVSMQLTGRQHPRRFTRF